MLSIPSAVKALFQTDGTHKNFRVHFPNGEMADITNDNVVAESVKFTESLCSQNTFKFGLAEASVLEFETVGIGNMYGMTIEASCEIDCSSLSAADKATIAAGTWDGTWDAVNEVFAVPYGVFRVNNCPRNHGAMAHRQVTAYSKLGSELFPFPSKSLAKEFYISMNGLMSVKDGSGLTEKTAATVQTFGINNRTQNFVVPSGSFASGVYLSSSNYFYWDISLCTGTTASPVNALNYAQCDYDVILPSGTFNTELVEKLKAVVAQSLEDSGIDLTKASYTGGGYNDLIQIYSDNLEAINAKTMAFGLTINEESGSSVQYPHATWEYTTNSNYKQTEGAYVAHSYTVPINDRSPVIGGITTSKAFYGNAYPNFWTSNHKMLLIFPKILTSDNVFLRVATAAGSVSFIKLRYAADDIDLIPFLTSDLNVTSVRQFSVNTPAPRCLIENSGAYDKYYYSYLGQGKKVSSIFKESLEVYAKYYKADRLGSFEAFSLDDSSPVSIAPGNYSECWWDEYDIDPVGTVNITYQGDDGSGNVKDNTTGIVIGTGQSIYDMTDNEALKSLISTDLNTIASLITTYFAPNARTVTFTPIEMTMQGWPWLEAGDALQITAEDGTVVDSYALRIEMSGIQNLRAAITAQGGEIIEEEE